MRRTILSGQLDKTFHIKEVVVASIIVEAKEQAGDIQGITVEAEVDVEAEVEVADLMEGILAILVERQVTRAETIPIKMMNANTMKQSVM